MSSCKPNFIFPGVTAKNSEVLSGTAASISCVVTGLTRQLDGVKWEKPDGTFIDSNSDGYTFEDGASNFGSNTQTTVLTIPSDINIVDAICQWTFAGKVKVNQYKVHRRVIRSATILAAIVGANET